MKTSWIFLGGSSQNWTSFRGNFYTFQGLLLRLSKNVDIFGGLLKFQVFFRVLDIPDITGLLTVDGGSKPTYEEK